METSKRRDCDFNPRGKIIAIILMEWRPQKEGIATPFVAIIFNLPSLMEWRPQKEGIATYGEHAPNSSGMPWMEWRPQKEGIATGSSEIIARKTRRGMEWRPQKEGIATGAATTPLALHSHDGMETSKRRDCDPSGRPTFVADEMEWRPQKEGIATGGLRL